jgi:anti-sigma factor RsiW
MSECDRMRLLLNADLDGELGAADSAALAEHVAGCADCARLQSELGLLQRRLRAELVFHPAPAALRRSLTPRRIQPTASWAIPASLALAASLALVILPRAPAGDSLIASHLHALQPGHLMDVASTDEHNVKPWFDGKLDYVPPVKDFAAQGYVLQGGRLDYLGGRPIAALVYHNRLHLIDVYVWPKGRIAVAAEKPDQGYNVVPWSQNGFEFRAVSDLNPEELRQFAHLWLTSN